MSLFDATFSMAVGMHVAMALFVLILAWFGLQWLQVPLRRMLKRHVEPATSLFVIRMVRAGMMVLVGMTVLASLGIDMKAMITGLGVTGLSVGLACKDMLSNLVAGMILLVHRPFRLKQVITIKGLKGQVMDINLRYTVLHNDSGQHMIPNTLFLTNPVEVQGMEGTTQG